MPSGALDRINRVKLLTLARDLKRRKARERRGLFVAEGVRVVEELLRSPLPITGVLVAPQLEDAPRGRELRAALELRGVDVVAVEPRELASAAETESPQGVLAIATATIHDLETFDPALVSRFVVLDGVQDPGNVGTIIRTAAALGAVVIALPGTVDLWNAKVIRGAMGAHFHVPSFSSTWSGLGSFLDRQQIPLWAADASGTTLTPAATRPPMLALAVGNEGAGISEAVRARAAQLVSIPIAPGVESLNVAVATGILLYALRA